MLILTSYLRRSSAMAIDFPASPTVGLKHPPTPVADVPQYTWDGEKWVTGIAGGSAFVSKAGDTMSGPLVLPANPTQPLQAATKQYVDAGGLGSTFVNMGGGRSFDVAVPTGATRAKFDGIVIPGSATNLVLLMQCSITPGVFLNANADYAISGFSHLSLVTPTAVSGASGAQGHPGFQLGAGNTVVNYAIIFDGQFVVKRANTTGRFSGDFRSVVNNVNGITHSFYQG